MSSTDITLKNGDISAYGFACGHVQRHKTIDSEFHYLYMDANEGLRVMVGIPGVTTDHSGYMERDDHGVMKNWYSFTTITGARRFYKRVANVIEMKNVNYETLREWESLYA